LRDENRRDVRDGDDPKVGAKRPYDKPSVAWVEKLGVKPGLAVACARAVMEDPMCASGGLAS